LELAGYLHDLSRHARMNAQFIGDCKILIQRRQVTGVLIQNGFPSM